MLRTPADCVIALLLLIVPVTLLATALPEITRRQVFLFLVGFTLYYTAVNWANGHSRLGWLRAELVAAGLGSALTAPYATSLLSGKFGFLQRGWARLPNSLSETVKSYVMVGILIVLVPLALATLLFCGGGCGGSNWHLWPSPRPCRWRSFRSPSRVAR